MVFQSLQIFLSFLELSLDIIDFTELSLDIIDFILKLILNLILDIVIQRFILNINWYFELNINWYFELVYIQLDFYSIHRLLVNKIIPFIRWMK